MTRFDDLCRADGKLSVVTLADHVLRGALHVESQHAANGEIEPAVHDREAVGRADHGIGGHREEVRFVD